jgi:cytoskeletal protein CcmA (bactofilin family)
MFKQLGEMGAVINRQIVLKESRRVVGDVRSRMLVVGGYLAPSRSVDGDVLEESPCSNASRARRAV